jgi:transcriptional regulator with XRE-family HTH domain
MLVNLRKARLSKDFTQTDVARACGVSPALISRLETGTRRGTLPVVLRIAAVLGVSVEDLAGKGAEDVA